MAYTIKHPLDLILLAILAVSVASILLGQEDSFVRTAICNYLTCPTIKHSHAWERIAYDLGVGSVISLFFYWLVARIPEHTKRQRIRHSFWHQYTMFKEDCIATMLMVTDGTFEWGFHRELLDQKKFRDYFQQEVAPGESRWDSLHNKMDEYSLGELRTSMEILRAEIVFVLTSADVRDEEVFAFLKRLSNAIVRISKTKLEYDSLKSFGGFMWGIFTGFDFVTGYQERDYVQKMLDAI